MDEIVPSPEEKTIKDEDMPQALERLKMCLLEVRKHVIECAGILASMSRPQLVRAKKFLKTNRLLNPEHVNRLVLLGRGLMPAYLAAPERSIAASFFMSLPEKVRAKLQDPDLELEIMTVNGVKNKRAKDMSKMELLQCLDPNRGILRGSEQHALLGEKIKADKHATLENLDTVESIRRLNDRWCILSSGNLKLKAEFKMLRRVLS